MTWEEWCNSEYNTSEISVVGSYVITGAGAYISLDGYNVQNTDIIYSTSYIANLVGQ